MNRDETKKILMNIQCSFANWKPASDLGFMVDVWSDDLADYSYEQVYTALKVYKSTDTSGFAPSIGQLIDCIHKLSRTNKEVMNANEAWALVTKAIRNSTYHADEEFEKLPEIAKKAVGSADNLRSMASNADFNDDVEKSLFTRIYDTEIKRKCELAKLPQSVKTAIGKSEVIGIGHTDD